MLVEVMTAGVRGSTGAGDGAEETDGTPFDDRSLTKQEPLRLSEGWAGFDDETLYLDRDGERVRVAFENVTEVTFRDYDYFLVVLSVVLVGFGVWFVHRTPASLLFSLVGLASLARLFRRRNEVTVRVAGRPKPIRFHPEDPGTFYDRLGREMEAEVVSDRTRLLG